MKPPALTPTMNPRFEVSDQPKTLYVITDGNRNFWFDGAKIDNEHSLTPGWYILGDRYTSWELRDDAQRVADGVGGHVITETEANMMANAAEKKNMPPRDWGREPWEYAPAGDSDGYFAGIDHFVQDADGNEIAVAPNERVGTMMAGSPDMLSALSAMIAAFPVVTTEEQKQAKRSAHRAIQKATGTQRQFPTEAAGGSIPVLYRRWLAAQTDTESTKIVHSYFSSALQARTEREKEAAKTLAEKVLTDHPPAKGQKFRWLRIDGRVFFVSFRQNYDDQPKEFMIEEHGDVVEVNSVDPVPASDTL